MTFVPSKLYYKIREVCEIVGVEAHVLRFWETEFPSLSPPKSKTGQRTYRPKDIELLLRIRKLLYEDGFTIAGARKQLNAEKSSESVTIKVPKPRPGKPPSDRLNKVKAELENILTLLDRE
jgi:DNA-binding transcriptional MerR regulator